MEAQRVPDHEVLVQNLAVLLRPARKTLARRRLVRKASGRVDLPGIPGEEEGAATTGASATGAGGPDQAPGAGTSQAGPRSFHGTAEVAAATAKTRLVEIADEIVSVLGSDPNGSVKVIVEISAEFPDGAKEQLKRAVSENARTLGLKSADWE